MSHYLQDKLQALSLSDPETFWLAQAAHLQWHKPPSAALRNDNAASLHAGQSDGHSWTWFPDGEISTCYNCVDRHVVASQGAHPALFWDSPVTGQKKTITYNELLRDVGEFAAVLREEGVGRGDVVLVYSMTDS